MPLSPGTRLGHYDVTALIGEGGMGQVWQATDTQLNRQVALKILPDAFASDPERLRQCVCFRWLHCHCGPASELGGRLLLVTLSQDRAGRDSAPGDGRRGSREEIRWIVP
ncbi:MAG: hypothetical protein ACE10G_02485 [Gemmatimonadales bacterium]